MYTDVSDAKTFCIPYWLGDTFPSTNDLKWKHGFRGADDKTLNRYRDILHLLRIYPYEERQYTDLGIGEKTNKVMVCAAFLGNTDFYIGLENVGENYRFMYLYQNATSKKFHTIRLRLYDTPRVQFPSSVNEILLRDVNVDSFLDEVSVFAYNYDSMAKEGVLIHSTTYRDSNFDGQIDTMLATNCEVPAIRVQTSGNPYSEEFNYCYNKDYESVLDFASMTGSLLVSGIAKLFKLTVIGTIAAAAVDCGAAFLYEKYAKTGWPA
jgi:hypothetical protein